MSGNADHIPGAGEPRELTNPLLWTAGLLLSITALALTFFHFKEIGRESSKGEPRWTVATKGPGEPDHKALGEDRSQAVLDRGEIIYSKNCVSCHGANGDAPVGNPPPRNFRKEAFKNPLGDGPYGFYSVLTNGFKGMPSYRSNLSPDDRYAVAHYVRETFMKPSNPAYIATDDAKVVAQIPAKGSGGSAGEVEIDPRAVTPAAPAYALMAVVAQQNAVNSARLLGWLSDAKTDCGTLLLPAFTHLDQVCAGQTGRLERLHAAITAQNRPAFDAALVAEDGAGSADPYFSLLPAATIDQLYARLAATATRMN